MPRNESNVMMEQPASAISFLGLKCNLYLFYKFVTRKSKSTGFQKLCTVKTVTNCTICISFLFWVVPVTFLSLTFNSLISICISSNRFYSLYFPFGITFLTGTPVTTIAIWAILISTSSLGVFSMIGNNKNECGCACLYDPNKFIWTGERKPCDSFALVFVPLFIFGSTTITNLFNIMTAVRLLMEKMTGMNVFEAKRRRKRWMIMFSQGVAQDCLQLIDIINSYYLYKLNEDLWFQVVTITFSCPNYDTRWIYHVHISRRYTSKISTKNIEKKHWRRKCCNFEKCLIYSRS
nr:hypothetical protein F09F3.3 - Caenorhabditis elegans [Caenorhabditis elegans]